MDLTNNGPALLDAPITFFAKLVHSEKNNPTNSTYHYEFEDDLHPRTKKYFIGRDTYNFTHSYSYDTYNHGHYNMSVVVKDQRKEIATNKTTFKLTSMYHFYVVVADLYIWDI